MLSARANTIRVRPRQQLENNRLDFALLLKNHEKVRMIEDYFHSLIPINFSKRLLNA